MELHICYNYMLNICQKQKCQDYNMFFIVFRPLRSQDVATSMDCVNMYLRLAMIYDHNILLNMIYWQSAVFIRYIIV